MSITFTATYTAQNAVDLVQDFLKGIAVGDVDERLVDMVNSEIWTFAPWEWSMSQLTSVALVDGQQDYAAGDTDIFRLFDVWITRTDLTPDAYNHLTIRASLPVELTLKGGLNSIRSIAWNPAASRLRLNRAADVPTGVTLQIDGDYQTNPTKITSLASTFTFPDYYFPIVVDGLLYRMYRYADDPRAGEMRVSKTGQVEYTGQLGAYMGGLMRMAGAESYGQTDILFPDNAFGDVRWNNPGLFGI